MENVRSSNMDAKGISEDKGLQEKNKENAELCSTGKSLEARSFLQFDVVTDYSDHRFANQETSIVSGSSTHKDIMKEWKLLNENLPDSIYVRIYETRIDLMRAVIVGVSGTPYHDGLFFFDIMIPEDYPNNIPRARFWSYGFKLNPNLYPGGEVCLSLLKRPIGKRDTKGWIPGKSTIFQLLISLQALVLNEEPLLILGEDRMSQPVLNRNKPTETWSRYEKSSMIYKNHVFASSCKLMVSILQSPPKNFEEIVKQHFFDRARFILSACVAYMNGYERVGCYQDHGSFWKEQVPMSSFLLKCSLDSTTYLDLVVAFCKIDPSLGEFLVRLHQMAEETKDRTGKEKRFQSGVRKVFNMLKKIVSVKKKKLGTAPWFDV